MLSDAEFLLDNAVGVILKDAGGAGAFAVDIITMFPFESEQHLTLRAATQLTFENLFDTHRDETVAPQVGDAFVMLFHKHPERSEIGSVHVYHLRTLGETGFYEYELDAPGPTGPAEG